MAIPTTEFGVQIGVAVMRQNPVSGEWFFVDWVRGSADFVLDAPGAGTWVYAHWFVVGNAMGTGATSATIEGRGSILTTNLKR